MGRIRLVPGDPRSRTIKEGEIVSRCQEGRRTSRGERESRRDNKRKLSRVLEVRLQPGIRRRNDRAGRPPGISPRFRGRGTCPRKEEEFPRGPRRRAEFVHRHKTEGHLRGPGRRSNDQFERKEVDRGDPLRRHLPDLIRGTGTERRRPSSRRWNVCKKLWRARGIDPTLGVDRVPHVGGSISLRKVGGRAD